MPQPSHSASHSSSEKSVKFFVFPKTLADGHRLPWLLLSAAAISISASLRASSGVMKISVSPAYMYFFIFRAEFLKAHADIIVILFIIFIEIDINFQAAVQKSLLPYLPPILDGTVARLIINDF